MKNEIVSERQSEYTASIPSSNSKLNETTPCSASSSWGKFLEVRGVPVDKIPYSELENLNNSQALEKCNEIVMKNGGKQFLFDAPKINDGLMSVIGLEVDPSNPQLL